LRIDKFLLFFSLIFLLAAFFAASDAHARNKVKVYLFWNEDCPHCKAEKAFLGKIGKKYPELDVKLYEVKENKENARLFTAMAEAYGIKIMGVPTTFIGDFKPIAGYRSDETTGADIEAKIKYCIEHECTDPMEKIAPPKAQKEGTGLSGGGTAGLLPGLLPQEDSGLCEEEEVKCEEEEKAQAALHQKDAAQKKGSPDAAKKQTQEAAKAPAVDVAGKQEAAAQEEEKLSLPVIGVIDTTKTSLPVLTLVIAGLDGFNPCAFFVLITLLGILIHAKSRRRMLLIGGIFVFFSGLVYFIFMSAWLNIFLLTGEIKAITIAAGIIALIIAAINIKDFFFFGQGVSLSIPEAAKPRLFDRMRRLMKATSLFSVIIGTVVLAVAANTYELFCTVGFPMVFTRALTMHKLPVFEYYIYLVLYNAIYVVPLAVIVGFFTLKLGAKKMSGRQGEVLKLVSGFMMLYLGLVILIRPGLLSNIFVAVGLLTASLATSGLIILIKGQAGKTAHGS
jgi:thiol-disulfide isomerase/thioredoxin